MNCKKHQVDSRRTRKPDHYVDCLTCKRIWDKAERRRKTRKRYVKKRQKDNRTRLKDKADRLFSQIVRMRGACVRCGSIEFTQTSHVVSRRYRAVRWEEENADVLCRRCHFWFEHFPVEARFWHEKKWPGRLARLERRAIKDPKPDVAEVVQRLEKRLRELIEAREQPYPSELDKATEVSDAKTT